MGHITTGCQKHKQLLLNQGAQGQKNTPKKAHTPQTALSFWASSMIELVLLFSLSRDRYSHQPRGKYMTCLKIILKFYHVRQAVEKISRLVCWRPRQDSKFLYKGCWDRLLCNFIWGCAELAYAPSFMWSTTQWRTSGLKKESTDKLFPGTSARYDGKGHCSTSFTS